MMDAAHGSRSAVSWLRAHGDELSFRRNVFFWTTCMGIAGLFAITILEAATGKFGPVSLSARLLGFAGSIAVLLSLRAGRSADA